MLPLLVSFVSNSFVDCVFHFASLGVASGVGDTELDIGEQRRLLVHVLCFSILVAFYSGNGRGGIRTHGGFPHARFRVECLKPDSATLPKAEKKTPNAQRPIFNVECKHTPEICSLLWTILSADMGILPDNSLNGVTLHR